MRSFPSRRALLALLLAGIGNACGQDSDPLPEPPESIRADLLPSPGTNPALRGTATEISVQGSPPESADIDPGAPGLACDGLPGTAWTASVAGPCSWRLELAEAPELGVVGILWQERPPRRYLLEGSENGAAWTKLAEVAPPAAVLPGEPNALHVHVFESRPYRQFRLSVPETPPGFVVAMREFAVYRNVSELPAAWRARLAPAASGDPGLRPGGSQGFPTSIQLTKGWRIACHAPVPDGWMPRQLVPTASGRAFALLTPEQNRPHRLSGKIVLLSPESGGGIGVSPFLADVRPGASIAWDGEWLYVMAEGNLTAYRSPGPGHPANERFRHGQVYSCAGAGTGDGVSLGTLRLGSDGWFHAMVSCPAPTPVRDAAGREIELPRSGLVRFRSDRTGLFLVTTFTRPVSTYRLDSPGGISIEPNTNPPFVMPPLPGSLATDATGPSPSFWTTGSELFSGSGDRPFAKVDGLLRAEADIPLVWLVSRVGELLHFARLDHNPPEAGPFPDWDKIAAAELPEFLSSPRPSVRREAGFEILRRKRPPLREVEALLSSGPTPDAAEGLLAYISGLGPDRALTLLRRLAASSDPTIASLGFRSLGDFPGRVDPSDFAPLGVSTEPAVTAAIFAALHRSRTELPGAESLAFALVDHDDPVLAETARNFLIAREAWGMGFAVLADPSREAEWHSAFTLLAAVPRPEVVGGILAQLETTRSPRLRRLALETLSCLRIRLDERDPGSEFVKSIDAELHEALFDHRTDRVALLEQMTDGGIPLPPSERLVSLARTDATLEAFVVGVLFENEDPCSAETLAWLSRLVGDRSRDEGLRQRALALVAGKAPSAEYRICFREVARRDFPPPTGASDLVSSRDPVLSRWLSRRDHGDQLPWLAAQIRDSDPAVSDLARRTLESLGLNDDPRPPE